MTERGHRRPCGVRCGNGNGNGNGSSRRSRSGLRCRMRWARRLATAVAGCLAVGGWLAVPLTAQAASSARDGERRTQADGDGGRRDGVRRTGQVWEVHLILPDGRRQVLRGVREPSRERRVVRLYVDAAPSDGDAARGVQGTGTPASPGSARRDGGGLPLRPPVEHLEGGHVAPKPVRGASGRRRVILSE